jgi:hypothetical protein
MRKEFKEYVSNSKEKTKGEEAIRCSVEDMM